MVATTERDVIIAMLLEKIMHAAHPDLDPTLVDLLAKNTDMAKRRQYDMTLPIE